MNIKLGALNIARNTSQMKYLLDSNCVHASTIFTCD